MNAYARWHATNADIGNSNGHTNNNQPPNHTEVSEQADFKTKGTKGMVRGRERAHERREQKHSAIR